MPASNAFLDSNVICYLFGADTAKADRAVGLLAERPIVSVQVLAEVCSVARRKARLTWPEIEEIIAVVVELCEVLPLTSAIQDQARALAASTSYAIYDAQIIAAAANAGCEILWSEDMQDGQGLSLDGSMLTIRNPF